ncbi:MAG: FG-GAP repeat protein [Flavobacterium sp.]|nr:FG-GAP repeat protein [Flavobacterium sp.]
MQFRCFSKPTAEKISFKLTNDELLQTDVLYPSDALTSDNFGASISIQNDFIAIGSPNHDANSNNSGAVYLYKRANNIWELIQKITAIESGRSLWHFVKIHKTIICSIDDEEKWSKYKYQ